MTHSASQIETASGMSSWPSRQLVGATAKQDRSVDDAVGGDEAFEARAGHPGGLAVAEPAVQLPDAQVLGG